MTGKLPRVEDVVAERLRGAAEGRAVVEPDEEALRFSLIGFTSFRMQKYQLSRVHLYVAEQLERVERGEIDRLMIRQPPRTGKIELGEGSVFALYGLLHDRTARRARMLLWALIAGAGLLIGDGMITPAISVLSAVEGLGVAVPGFASLVVPITLGLLIALFAIQFKGASGVGFLFGPVVLVWFVGIAALGAFQIAVKPEILAAFNPVHGLPTLLLEDGTGYRSETAWGPYVTA
jgi:hypothetical protein